MLKRMTIFCLVMTCMLACPGFLIAQETDFTVVISDSADPVMPESIVNFEFEVANAGPDGSPFPIILDITLPMDVPVPFRDYLAADEEGRAAIIEAFLSSANLLIDDNIWNADVSGTFIGDSLNNGCAGMMVQPQELVLPAGTFGSIYFDVNNCGSYLYGNSSATFDIFQIATNNVTSIGNGVDLNVDHCGYYNEDYSQSYFEGILVNDNLIVTNTMGNGIHFGNFNLVGANNNGNSSFGMGDIEILQNTILSNKTGIYFNAWDLGTNLTGASSVSIGNDDGSHPTCIDGND